MEKIGKRGRGQSVQFLFTMLLFLILTICAVFTITFGAKVYKNIDARMNENFIGTTALSYVSNKVKQADETDAISVIRLENTQVLRIQQVYNETKYLTLIYYRNGNINELFIGEDSQFTLDDGIPIMESEGLSFKLVGANLLKVETAGNNGDAVFLALRSEEDQDD